MKVVATARGYLGAIREPGDTFDVPDGTKGSWFNPVADVPVEAPVKVGKSKGKPDPNDTGEDGQVI